MDLASTFDDVVKIAKNAENPDAGWAFLVGYLEKRGGEPLRQLAAVDIQRDVDKVRGQIRELVSGEPPPNDLNAVYFGLFDTEDDEGAETIGYYITGVTRFDPKDGDSLCNPAWWPDARYLTSATLNAIKGAEVSAAASGQTDLRQLLGYSGQLGAALLLSRFASAGLFPGLHQVVGFDSGDFAQISA
jgi:hypothetical protein